MNSPLSILGAVKKLQDAVNSGNPVVPVINPGSNYTASFPSFGDLSYRILLNENLNLDVTGGVPNQLQTITFIIQQPVSGNCEITLDSAIQWINKAPFIDSRIGEFTFFRIFTFDGGKTYWGSLING